MSNARKNQPSDRQQTHAAIAGWKLWMFSFIVIVVFPILILFALEGALRIIGYGYSPNALVKVKWKDQTAYGNNYQFGFRFWPKRIAREAEPFFFTEKKPKDTYRIFVLGGSAALGTPEPSYSFSRLLELMLENQYPQVNFEIINTAMTAINSHVALPIAKHCADANGDLFIVYIGNNEVIGPYGAGTIFAPIADSMKMIRLHKALQATRLGQLIRTPMNRKYAQKAMPQVWGGTKMFMENLVRKDDKDLQTVYRHYKENLEDITTVIRDRDAQVILCSVGSNLKDCPPFASLHRLGLTDEQKQQWQLLYDKAVEYENQGEYAQALESFIAAGQIDAEYADLCFKTANAYWQLGQFEKATQQYIMARQSDTLRLRADNRINQIVRQVAGANKGDGVYFVDSCQAFQQNSPHNTPGEELFYEHVHMNFKGNYVLAKAIFNQVEEVLPASIKSKRADLSILSEDQCAAGSAYTNWDKYNITRKLLTTFIKKPPFTSRLYNDALEERMEQQINELSEYSNVQNLAISEKKYLEAIEKRPDDWWLHMKYARLLKEGLQNHQAAAEQYRIVTELLPFSYPGYAEYGFSMVHLNDLDQAVSGALAALDIKPECADAYHILGLSYLMKGQPDKAIKNFSMEVQISPDHAQGYNRMGVLLDQQGKTAEAEQVYLDGLTHSPDDIMLSYNMALLLAKQKRFNEAAEYLHAGLKANPNSSELLKMLRAVERATGR
jgi:tetratricopeptide (TPR) repeat protein